MNLRKFDVSVKADAIEMDGGCGQITKSIYEILLFVIII